VLAGAAAAVLTEGILLPSRAVIVAGSAALLVPALFAIAIGRPDNVQAYTAPIGLYLFVLGATFRRSPELFERQMYMHEAVGLAGLLLLVLPPASQSFQPGGDVYGLELIGMGLAFLALGFVMEARWTVAGGVLTLTGVALRWLQVFGEHAPRWLILGLVGTALIGIGLLLLFERERWERLRWRIGRWWLSAPNGSGHGAPPHAV
jgi:hypothetical protein